jgi:hypothetical protein
MEFKGGRGGGICKNLPVFVCISMYELYYEMMDTFKFG